MTNPLPIIQSEKLIKKFIKGDPLHDSPNSFPSNTFQRMMIGYPAIMNSGKSPS